MFCHFGNKLTQRFEDVGDNAYAYVAWYMLPMDMQKSYPMILRLGQQNVYLRGFADTRFTREVFMLVFTFINGLSKNVYFREIFQFYFQILKNTFSYFMVLRKIAL